MDIPALARELADDPLGLGYAALSDAEAADALNAPSRPGRQVVRTVDVRRYVLLHGIWPAVQAVAANAPDDFHRGTAVTILQTLAPNSFDEIRMDEPEIRAAVSGMLDTMVAAGAMTAQHKADMMALGDATVSRAAELGLGPVHHLDVAEARRAPDA
jgi:hypothetical protein